MDVVTFYRFVRIDAPSQLAAVLRAWSAEQNLTGTIVLAHEGINATLAGAASDLHEFVARLGRDPRFAEMVVRASRGDATNPIFHRMKVQVRAEIVALKCAGLDPSRRTGIHVDAARWNRLLDEPNVLVIDARNQYEIALGAFPGARDPHTRSFREFPRFVDGLDNERHRPIAMYCTGGIRCEKASAYLFERGFAEVYQLDGGILNYLATVGADNRFDGECFVFDQRVSLGDRLEQGAYTTCHACRHPLTEAECAAPGYVDDMSCPYCVDRQTPLQRASFRERARQVRLSAARGKRHVGAAMARKERP